MTQAARAFVGEEGRIGALAPGSTRRDETQTERLETTRAGERHRRKERP